MSRVFCPSYEQWKELWLDDWEKSDDKHSEYAYWCGGINYANEQSAMQKENEGLRDMFAAEAMQAWIQALSLRHKEPGYTDEGALNEAVRLSGLAANAMIKERGE